MKAVSTDPRPIAQRTEDFVRWFLRFNGYFSIENFIVHDPSHTKCGYVGQQTESDILAIRMPYSSEQAGPLRIANYQPLVSDRFGKFDIVIAEAKSGDTNQPNGVWREHSKDSVKYLLQFIGFYNENLAEAVSSLAQHYCYEDGHHRCRYIVVSPKPNEDYASKGVTYFTYRHLAEFLVEVRGQCWIETNIGVASVHHQWDPMIRTIFEIANCQEETVDERVNRVFDVILAKDK